MTFKSDWKVGLFILTCLATLGALTFSIGKPGGFFSRRLELKAYFVKVEGLNIGSDVRYNGIQVGTVNTITFGDEIGKVLVSFYIAKNAADRIRSDATIQIQTLGLLGDKYVSITGGTKESPVVVDGQALNSYEVSSFQKVAPNTEAIMNNVYTVTEQLKEILARLNEEKILDKSFESITLSAQAAKVLIDELTKSTNSLKSGVSKLDSSLSKVDNGKGTLGSLVNDPTVYDQLKSILGGVERNKVLKYVIRNNIKQMDQE